MPVIHLYSATPTLRITFISTPPLRPPWWAAPPAGSPTANVGNTPGRGSASDSPESPRTPRSSLAGQRGGSESSSECPEAMLAEEALGVTAVRVELPSSPFSSLPSFHTNLVRVAIRVTGLFCPFELCNRIKACGDAVPTCAGTCSCLSLPMGSSCGLSPQVGMCV